MDIWVLFWLVWIGAGIGLEIAAVLEGKTTLSALLRELVQRKWAWAAGMGLALWAIWHVFFGGD